MREKEIFTYQTGVFFGDLLIQNLWRNGVRSGPRRKKNLKKKKGYVCMILCMCIYIWIKLFVYGYLMRICTFKHVWMVNYIFFQRTLRVYMYMRSSSDFTYIHVQENSVMMFM